MKWLVVLVASFFLINILNQELKAATIPVIFVHRSNSSYLQYSLSQALEYNSRVILLGDESNCGYAGIEHHLMDNYFTDAAYFQTIYQHIGENSYGYELFCFQRWFIINEFVKKHGIKEFFYCDSDVMLYCDVTDEHKFYCDADAAIMIRQKGASGGVAYLNDNIVDHFCRYVACYYANSENLKKWIVWFNKPTRPKGYGVCDMTLFWEYCNDVNVKQRYKIKNILDIVDNSQFDHHMGSDEYGAYELATVYSGTSAQTVLKKIVWIDNFPWVYNRILGRLIRFKALHFQGGRRKNLMKEYLRPKMR